MGDAWIIDLLKYSPVPVACLIVIYKLVCVFIAHMETRDTLLSEIGESCHSIQRLAIDAINKNTEQQGRVEILLMRLNGKAPQVIKEHESACEP